MSLNRTNQLSKGKTRFLPPGFKDLGVQVKKQKLDITISKQNSSKNDSFINDGEDDGIKELQDDDLWGADLPEEVVEECLTMATQVYTQDPNKPSTSKAQFDYSSLWSHKPINHQVLSNSISLINESAKFQNDEQFKNFRKKVDINTPSTSKNTNSSKLFPRFNSDSKVSDSPKQKAWIQASKPDEVNNEKLKKQLEQLNQEMLTKQGEVTYLRNQIHNFKKEKQKEIDNLTRNFKSENQKLKEDLAKAQTLLQFTALEANNDRCKLMEANKNKGHSSPEKIKYRSFTNSVDELASLAKRAKHLEKKSTSNKLVETDPIHFNKKQDLELYYSDGMVLKEMLMPDFFEKSDCDYPLVFMDVEKIKTKAIKGINRKELSRWPAFTSNDFNIHSCSSYITELFLIKNINDISANIYIDKIFENCLKILVNQLILLNYAESEQTIDDLDNRDKYLMEFSDKEPKGVFRSLLDPRRWYKEERGIEARRALGLLSSLARINEHASKLLLTSQKPQEEITSKYSDVIFPVKTPKFLFNSNELQNSRMMNDRAKNFFLKSNHDSNKSIKDKLQEIYYSNTYGFLNLLQQLVKSISSQRRSLQFTPFLCGVLQIIKYLPLFCGYNEETSLLIVDILKNISHARPRIEGIIYLLECLSNLKCYPIIMNKLCLNKENSSFVDTSHGLIFLYQDACVIQLISWLVIIPSSCVISRSRISSLMFNWLLGCFRADKVRVPHWLGAGTKDLCRCRSSIIESAIRLLYQTFCDYQTNLPDLNLKEDIRLALARGIQLLYIFMVKDPDFGVHMNRAEGEYNLVIRGLKDIGSQTLRLDVKQAQEFNELIEAEEDFSRKSIVSNSEVEVFYNSLCKDMINSFKDFKFDF